MLYLKALTPKVPRSKPPIELQFPTSRARSTTTCSIRSTSQMNSELDSAAPPIASGFDFDQAAGFLESASLSKGAPTGGGGSLGGSLSSSGKKRKRGAESRSRGRSRGSSSSSGDVGGGDGQDRAASASVPAFASASASAAPSSSDAAAAQTGASRSSDELPEFWKKIATEVESFDTNTSGGHAFPLTRLKRIAKHNERIRMVTAEVPCILSMASAIFVREISQRSWLFWKGKKRRTIQDKDVAGAVETHGARSFDFLTDIISNAKSKSASSSSSSAAFATSSSSSSSPSHARSSSDGGGKRAWSGATERGGGSTAAASAVGNKTATSAAAAAAVLELLGDQ